MLFVIVLTTVSSVIGSVIGADPPGGYYTPRYDHLDIENILNHKRLVVYYAACLLEKGPCTPQGTEFKSILPEAIKTNCLRCTEKQRTVTTRSIRRLQKEYPDIWAQLEKRWDPTGENVKRLLASVNRPRPVSEVTLLFDRFGEDKPKPNERQSEEIVEEVGSTTSSPSTTISETPTTTASTISAASTTSTTTTASTPSTSTATPRTTTWRQYVKPATSGPFNSIGANLVVLNPKALIDQVIKTADVVLNTVSGVFKG